MHKIILFYLGVILLSILSCNSTPNTMQMNFDDYPVYQGSDLEMVYTPEKTFFRLWAPTAEEAIVRLYANDLGGDTLEVLVMQADIDGTWISQLEGDHKNTYYTFQVRIGNKWMAENSGLYAKALGANGRRAMIVDMQATNPVGWENDTKPAFIHTTDAIIYEMHVRDFSISPNSGLTHKGKYLAFTETGTHSPEGNTTGIDHLKELGVTHVHLLPVFDFRSVDETLLDENKYNWGYDPQNYNTPEGSYATNPHDGNVRIKEFKEMVQALHQAGIRVVMDVVYNHTGYTIESNFNQLVPKYFYRLNADSSFANASGCGNETASERAMMRRYMVESVKYWMQEYHIDGFRFDLMGIHDIETMNTISRELHAIDNTVIIYGEGWTAGDSPLPVDQRALKNHVTHLDKIAVFSDDIRDAIKGSWMSDSMPGFMGNALENEETIKSGIVASIHHPQIDYNKVHGGNHAWASEPWQVISYVSCHDNHTLWDRNLRSFPQADDQTLRALQKLGNSIVLTSQGVTFIHAGSEFARTKQGEGNSYQSPDSINQIDWSRKAEYNDVFIYYKNLIELRKSHPAFRMTSGNMIRQHLSFLEVQTPGTVAYRISGNANQDKWREIIVIYNGNFEAASLDLPEGKWSVVAENGQIQLAGEIRKLPHHNVQIPAISMTILVDSDSL